jgi:hypothetical protein
VAHRAVGVDLDEDGGHLAEHLLLRLRHREDAARNNRRLLDDEGEEPDDARLRDLEGEVTFGCG